jgi:hypothetical protein
LNTGFIVVVALGLLSGGFALPDVSCNHATDRTSRGSARRPAEQGQATQLARVRRAQPEASHYPGVFGPRPSRDPNSSLEIACQSRGRVSVFVCPRHSTITS